MLDCWSVIKRVYSHILLEPLQLKGKYSFNVQVLQTRNLLYTEFYVIRGKAATLPGHEVSELLGVLNVRVSLHKNPKLCSHIKSIVRPNQQRCSVPVACKREQGLSKIQDLLTTAQVMAYHRQGATTRPTTDAYPVGVGAILKQIHEDETYRPVYNASQKSSKVEARYSQFEREALAVRWSCEKLYLYLYGIKFDIRTDHKPLVTFFCPDRKVAPVLAAIQIHVYTLTRQR